MSKNFSLRDIDILGEASFRSGSMQTNGQGGFSGDYVEGEVLVKYKEEKVNLKTAAGRSSSRNFGISKALEKKEDLRIANTSVFKIKDGKSVEETITELKKDSRVEYAQPNYRKYPATINTNDTHKNLLWGLHNYGQSVNGTSGTVDADIDAPEAWELYDLKQKGTTPIIVAIIDDGVAYNHPDLINNMWDGSNCKDENGNFLGGCIHGYDFADNDKNPLPNGSHGTHVAGIIGAEKNNSIGVLGVAPDVKIMVLRFGFDDASEAKAIDFAIQNGAKIINASYGGTGYSLTERNAINRFRSSGGIFVAAAGNDTRDNDSTPFYPASHTLDNIISVAATNQNDGLAYFSNYGSTSVDVGAPGTNVYSTWFFTTFDEDFTSVTTPNIGSKFIQSGDSSWGTVSLVGIGKVIAGDYANFYTYRPNINSNLDTIPINLTGRPDSYLGFFIQCGTVSGDGVELSLWNGSTWDSLGMYPSSAYLDEQIPLSSEYIISDFKVRFKWVTDGEGTGDYTCFLDDIRVIDGSSGSETGLYMYAQGTSMAAPYVSGLAALIWAYEPTLTFTQVRDLILNTGDSITALDGQTSTGKRVNAHGALVELDQLSVDQYLVPTHRFWSDLLGKHFFTASDSEKNLVISTWPDVWSYEGTRFKVYTKNIINTTPVYRFWSDYLQGHFYTASLSERNSIIANYPIYVWKYEGIAYYVYGSQILGSKPVYRFWSDHLQAHFYTDSENEKNYIIQNYPPYVWNYERIAFYVK